MDDGADRSPVRPPERPGSPSLAPRPAGSGNEAPPPQREGKSPDRQSSARIEEPSARPGGTLPLGNRERNEERPATRAASPSNRSSEADAGRRPRGDVPAWVEDHRTEGPPRFGDQDDEGGFGGSYMRRGPKRRYPFDGIDAYVGNGNPSMGGMMAMGLYRGGGMMRGGRGVPLRGYHGGPGPMGPMTRATPPGSMFRPGAGDRDFAFGFDGFGFAPMGGCMDYDFLPPGMHRRFRRRGWGSWGMGGRSRSRPGPLVGKARADANDYNQHFVDTGFRPQNFLRDSNLEDQYEDYPNAKRLAVLKDAIIKSFSTPPYYLKADLKTFELSLRTVGTKFDVVLIDPPWEEYVRRAPGVGDGMFWKWEEIRDLKVEDVMDSPSFVFLWCGSEEGLEAGRHCLNKWGYRRCEDIVWIKTNKQPHRKYLSAANQEALSVLQHTKEHCLMGIKGTVRRTQDGHVIHANCDTDVIVSEEPPLGSTEKPEQMYSIIERFCLGRRRLELFGEDHNIRPGWVTMGNKLSTSNFKAQTYASHFQNPDGSTFICTLGRPEPGQPNLLPTNSEIEALRPRSPPPPPTHN